MKKSKLLNLYERVNPSIRTSFKEQSKVNLMILEKKFNFDMSFFKNKSVLDIASGIGDNAINFAINGAKVTMLDFNINSLNYAKKVFKKRKIKNCDFIMGDFFRLSKKLNKKYDFINCTGALHHFNKSNKYSLEEIFRLLKKNGYLFISVGTNSGGLQHKLMKAISRKWGLSEDKIKQSSKLLFKEYISRSIKYGMRVEDQVIFDQFINPIHNYIDIEELAQISKKKNIEILHSEPKIQYLEGDSVRKKFNNLQKYFMSENFRQQYYWSLKNKDDKDYFFLDKKITKSFHKFIKIVNKNSEKKNFFKNRQIFHALKKFNINQKLLIKRELNTLKQSYKFYIELENFLKPLFYENDYNLKTASKKLNKSKKLFKNTAGLTLNYFLLKKR